MANQEEKTGKKEKPYDGKIKGDSFDIIRRCQTLAAEIFNASAGATKEYRFTVCKVLQTYACELIHTARQANSYDLFKQTSERRLLQDQALELMYKIKDILPVVRRCRCITTGQETELGKKVSNLGFAFDKWMKSDEYRLKTSGKSKK
jgi:hypothetical protein